MSNKTANTVAKIPAARTGPRQLNTMPLPVLFSNMFQELALILAVSGDRLRGQRMKPVPNPIELPETAAQFLRNFGAHFKRGLRPTAPTAGEFMEVFAIRAITSNRQPFALSEARKQTEVRRAQ